VCIWFRARFNGQLLLTQLGKFGVSRKGRISSLAKQLLAHEIRLHYMTLVLYLLWYLFPQIKTLSHYTLRAQKFSIFFIYLSLNLKRVVDIDCTHIL